MGYYILRDLSLELRFRLRPYGWHLDFNPAHNGSVIYIWRHGDDPGGSSGIRVELSGEQRFVQVLAVIAPVYYGAYRVLTPYGVGPAGWSGRAHYWDLSSPNIAADLAHVIRTCGLAWVSGGSGRGTHCTTCPNQLECLTKEA